MEREVDDRVVAMEAVVASSKDGGVQGRRSGRPVEASPSDWGATSLPLARLQELAFFLFLPFGFSILTLSEAPSQDHLVPAGALHCSSASCYPPGRPRAFARLYCAPGSFKVWFPCCPDQRLTSHLHLPAWGSCVPPAGHTVHLPSHWGSG